jgi:hypothetical protein
MSLYHHDSRDYNEAASAAATKARLKMQGVIDRGRENAQAVIEQVLTQLPTDHVVGGRALKFLPVAEGVDLAIADNEPEHLHRFALGQIAERSRIPMAYVNTLAEGGEWGHELLAHNLNALYHEGAHTARNYLVRSVRHQVRGFLSDRYRRLDSRPIVESFCAIANKLGAVPVEGYALETKIALKAMLPMVFEPVPNEVVCFGVVLENSDFGNGVLSLRGFMMRLWCTNFAISNEALRQVHLGKQLSSDFAFSQRTYELDTKAAASAVGDLVKGMLLPAKVDEACALIKRANEEEVAPSQVSAFLKKHLNKTETEQVTAAYNSADVVNMPAGQTAWRLSNAISWVGGKLENRERGLELMKLAHAAAEA